MSWLKKVLTPRTYSSDAKEKLERKIQIKETFKNKNGDYWQLEM